MCPYFECMSIDLAFLLDAFPLDDETHFLFILFYFFKGKQNKKENPKCDFLFGKDRFRKNRVWVRK